MAAARRRLVLSQPAIDTQSSDPIQTATRGVNLHGLEWHAHDGGRGKRTEGERGGRGGRSGKGERREKRGEGWGFSSGPSLSASPTALSCGTKTMESSGARLGLAVDRRCCVDRRAGPTWGTLL